MHRLFTNQKRTSLVEAAVQEYVELVVAEKRVLESVKLD